MRWVQYVPEGERTSSLAIHAARPDGLARCGTRPLRWWDRRAGRYRAMVPIVARGPVTCGRPECRAHA